MICQEPVTDYRLVCVDEICALLELGWCLYGQPLLHTERILQAMVRPLSRIVPSGETPRRKPLGETLSPIEVGCVTAHAQGLKYDDVAKQVHRSTQTVSNTFFKLREHWNCHNNAQLIAILLQDHYLH